MASSLVIVASASPMQHARIVAVVIANSKRPGMSCTNRVAVPVGRGDAGAAIDRDVADGQGLTAAGIGGDFITHDEATGLGAGGCVLVST